MNIIKNNQSLNRFLLLSAVSVVSFIIIYLDPGEHGAIGGITVMISVFLLPALFFSWIHSLITNKANYELKKPKTRYSLILLNMIWIIIVLSVIFWIRSLSISIGGF